jgi:predicted transposase/invertase (TIGR01784 family)
VCRPSKYIDPFTDFGFKWLFGNIKHKRILIRFLNDLIDDLNFPIVDIEYRNLEKMGLNIVDRKAIFDIYCTDESGDHFIVELQRSRQKYFKNRSLYYTSFPIQEQAKRGDWDYRLNRVYFIALMEFNIDERELSKKGFSIR